MLRRLSENNGAVSFRRKRTKTAEALSKNSASAVLLCNLKEFKVENPWFSSFLLKFLFYRRLLNSRRTLVRLRSQTTLSALNQFAPRFCSH